MSLVYIWGYQGCWRLNQTHFLRWLSLCGLACLEDDSGEADSKVVSSTNANLYLRLCAHWGAKRSFESLHDAFQERLLALEVPRSQRDLLKALAAKVTVLDTPGNACKVLSVGETFVYGTAGNSTNHNYTVVQSDVALSVCKKHTFHS